MLNEPAVIGADLGTSSMKALLVTLDGTVLAEATREYPMHHARPGENDNDPGDWASAFTGCVRHLAQAAGEHGVRVAAVCLVGQRDPFVLLDRNGVPTTASISWTDQRSPVADRAGAQGRRLGPADRDRRRPDRLPAWAWATCCGRGRTSPRPGQRPAG